jgi:hypothetical protein
MDKLKLYRNIVRGIIKDYASGKPSNGQIETEAIIDREHDHYEVMHVGWDGHAACMARSCISTSSATKFGSSTMAQIS